MKENAIIYNWHKESSNLQKRIAIIGYVATQKSGWGIARYTFELLRNFKLMQELNNFKIDFIAHGTPPSNIIARNLKKILFFSTLTNLDASLYHAVTPIFGLPLATFKKKPFIVTVHDLLGLYQYYAKYHGVRRFIDEAYTGYVLDNADAIITTAEYWKQDVIHRFHVSAKKVHTVYNGFDDEKFKQIPKIRKKYPKRVLYIGSPTVLKGLCILIEGFALASKELKDAEFLIGGKTSRGYILKLSKKFGVNVKHIGFVPEEQLPYLYSSAHIFVNPPTDEFSLMLLEAMACGTPIIARDIFEMREYLGDAALMVNSDGPDELAEAIIKLLSDEELWFKLSRKGLESARAFTWRTTAEKTYSVYTKLLK